MLPSDYQDQKLLSPDITRPYSGNINNYDPVIISYKKHLRVLSMIIRYN